MLIVDSQIHIWQNGKMSAHHRQDATYSYERGAGRDEIGGRRLRGDPSAGLARRARQYLRHRSGEAPPGQVLHPREFRSPEPRPREHRRALARTLAGHAGVPLQLQRAASEDVVDRRLARLVLEGVREGGPARRVCSSPDRPSRCSARSPSGIPGSRCTSITSAAAAAGPPSRTTRPMRTCREMLALGEAAQCRGQAVGRAEHFEPALPVQEHPRLPEAESSTRSVPTAASGAPTSPACRSRTGNA